MRYLKVVASRSYAPLLLSGAYPLSLGSRSDLTTRKAISCVVALGNRLFAHFPDAPRHPRYQRWLEDPS
jgi:hypothetical protein